MIINSITPEIKLTIFIKKVLPALVIFILFASETFSQKSSSDSAITAIKNFRQELNAAYKHPEHSPLDEKSRKKFRKHNFYPINLKYRVIAKLKTTPDEPFFELKTSSGKTKLYRKYGEVTFMLDAKEYTLNVYQGKALLEKEEYKNYLFVPFKDHTSGNETYGGGRYLDLRIPANDDKLWLDFNMAYNPYCAYSDKYNCPVVPVENYLDTEIKAGILLKQKH